VDTPPHPLHATEGGKEAVRELEVYLNNNRKMCCFFELFEYLM
jgi:hypothetical protein